MVQLATARMRHDVMLVFCIPPVFVALVMGFSMGIYAWDTFGTIQVIVCPVLAWFAGTGPPLCGAGFSHRNLPGLGRRSGIRVERDRISRGRVSFAEAIFCLGSHVSDGFMLPSPDGVENFRLFGEQGFRSRGERARIRRLATRSPCHEPQPRS